MIPVYYSRTGITERCAKQFAGIHYSEYRGGEFVLFVPSYGAPRTGDHVPKELREWLEDHHTALRGIVGVGNRTFGPEFCAGAYELCEKYQVPLVAAVDILPTAKEQNIIINFLTEVVI